MPPLLSLDRIRTVIEVGQFGKCDLDSISCVSRQVRKLALPQLFHTISLRIGIKKTLPQHLRDRDYESDSDGDDSSEFDYTEDGYSDSDEELIEVEYAKRTLEVLKGMGQEEDNDKKFPFVHLVQELRITSYDVHSKQNRYIRLALKKLTNLQHFHWNAKSLPEDIAVELSRLNILISLNVSGIDDELRQTLRKLKNIESLEVLDDSMDYLSFGRYLANRVDITVPVELLRKSSRCLKKLSLYEGAIEECLASSILPAIAANLTHFAFFGISEPAQLGQFLLSASSLESLTMMGVETLDSLPFTAEALPHLQYLKLGITRTLDLDERNSFTSSPDMVPIAEDLLKFVRLHRHLHGFDISFYVIYEHDFVFALPRGDEGHNLPWFKVVVLAIQTLENVRVLGVTIPAMDKDSMKMCLHQILNRKKLRNSCTAIRLGGLSEVDLQDLPTKKLRNCSFISLSTGRPEEHFYNPCDPSYPTPWINVLVHCHSRCPLKQFHLNGSMYDVDAIRNEIGDIVAWKWSTKKSRRSEVDFCSFEAYWLMKYRTIKKDYESTLGEDD